MDYDKLDKEVEFYKNSSKRKLEKVIKQYKLLLFWARHDVNFIYTFLFMMIPAFFFGLNLFLLTGIIIIHYLYFWKYLILNCGETITSQQQADEIRYVISKLNEYLEKK
jgi:hypothetical protein